MSLDGVWEQIKSDESKVYGMKMIDVFIMLTKELDSKHYEQLTSEQKKNLSGDAAFGLLSLATISDQSGKLFTKRIKDMGSAVDRMDSGQLYLLIDDICANIGFIDFISLLGNNLKKINDHDSYVTVSRIFNRISGQADGQKLFKKSIENAPNGQEVAYESEVGFKDLLLIFRDLFLNMKAQDLSQIMARYDFSFELLDKEVLDKLDESDLLDIIHYAPMESKNSYVGYQKVKKAKELKKIFGKKFKISNEDFVHLIFAIEHHPYFENKKENAQELIGKLKEAIYG